MQRDFVVQIRQDIDLQPGLLHGRKEYVDSGRSSRFRNLDEFLALAIRFAAPEPETATL